MKIVKSLNRLSLRCKVLHCKPLFYYSTQATCSNYGVETKDGIPFKNPDRQQHQSNLDLNRADFPLQVSLFAKRNENNGGRVYSGDNPSVTTILNETRPKSELYALLNWRRGLIKQLGEEGYNDKVLNITNRGTTFHQAIKQYLLTHSQPIVQESNLGHWESVQNVLKDIKLVVALESGVVHPQLNYAGTLDGIVMYQGQLCVIEWKTSERKRTELKDCFSYPHQTVAYAGAVNYDQNYHPLQINQGLLVLAYLDGSPADTIWLQPDTCEFYWKEWLQRVQQYNQTNTLMNRNQGKPICKLAHYVNGVSRHKHVLDGNGRDIQNADIAEWSETIVDVFEMDPSLCTFDETENS